RPLAVPIHLPSSEVSAVCRCQASRAVTIELQDADPLIRNRPAPNLGVANPLGIRTKANGPPGSPMAARSRTPVNQAERDVIPLQPDARNPRAQHVLRSPLPSARPLQHQEHLDWTPPAHRKVLRHEAQNTVTDEPFPAGNLNLLLVMAECK